MYYCFYKYITVKLHSFGLIIEGVDKESPTKVGLKLKGRNLTLVDIHLSIRTGQYFNAKCVP